MRIHSWYKHNLVNNTDISIQPWMKHRFAQDLIQIEQDQYDSSLLQKLDWDTQYDINKLLNILLFVKNPWIDVLTKFWKRNDWAHLHVYLIISKKLFKHDSFCWRSKNFKNLLAYFAIELSHGFNVNCFYENNDNYILEIYREASY